MKKSQGMLKLRYRGFCRSHGPVVHLINMSELKTVLGFFQEEKNRKNSDRKTSMEKNSNRTVIKIFVFNKSIINFPLHIFGQKEEILGHF